MNSLGSARKMSGILRFNIIAAGALGTYYLFSKYSNWRSLQAEYCTSALSLLRAYPEVRQILGSNIRLTKLLTGARSRDDLASGPADGGAIIFTDLSQARQAVGPASVRVKCEVKGSKTAGQLYVWASKGGAASTGTPPTAGAPSSEFDIQVPTAGSSQPAATDNSGNGGFFASQPSAFPDSNEAWTIDKLALQIPAPLNAAAKKSSTSQLRWTVYESFASRQQAKNRQEGQVVVVPDNDNSSSSVVL